MPRRSLSREAIVAASFDVLERSGLAGVTARAVATGLGVQPGALYYHLPDMAALLDEMATAVQRRMAADPPESEDWAELLAALAGRVRAVLLQHRDGGRLFAGRRLRDPALLPAMEAPLARLTAAGLPLAQAVWSLQAAVDLTVGFVIEEQHRGSEESGRYDAATRAAALDPAAAPLTAAASAPMLADPDERFAFALGLLIDGVRARTASAQP